MVRKAEEEEVVEVVDWVDVEVWRVELYLVDVFSSGECGLEVGYSDQAPVTRSVSSY